MTLNNKVALVTSATRGIGFSSSLKLAQEGATVYMGVRRMEDTQKICDSYPELKMIPVYFNAYEEDTYKSMIDTVIELSNINPDKKVNEITKEERQRLVKIIKGLEVTIKGLRPVEEAIITAGGVSIKEINPKTMESKLINGLYFAGEIIDVDAYTGGFNLQIAYSTGYTAGKIK